ncbi:MAG: hypothetical protein AB7V46_18220 [Thermomicrobiales bacterium]
MKVRSLNADGLELFHQELIEIKERTRSELSRALLDDPALSSEISRYDCTPTTFKSRWDVAQQMDTLITEGALSDFWREAGFWGWLTVFHFNEICPLADDGSRPDLKTSTGVMRYFPQMTEWRRYYRHLLAGPWMIYRAHLEDPRLAMPLLATAVDSPGEAVEQLASRQEFVTSPTIMGAFYRLYYNPKTHKLRKGTSRKKNGGARRFVTVLQQFDVTYDLYSLSSERLIELLPGEFDEFKFHQLGS